MADANEPLLAGVRQLVYQRAVPLGTRSLRITRSTLDDRAGVVGAAVMLIEHIFSPDAVDATARRGGSAGPPDPKASACASADLCLSLDKSAPACIDSQQKTDYRPTLWTWINWQDPSSIRRPAVCRRPYVPSLASQLRLLQAAAIELAEAMTLERLAAIVTAAAKDGVDADVLVFGAIRDEGGRHLRVVQAHATPRRGPRPPAAIPLDGAGALAQVVQTGQPAYVRTACGRRRGAPRCGCDRRAPRTGGHRAVRRDGPQPAATAVRCRRARVLEPPRRALRPRRGAAHRQPEPRGLVRARGPYRDRPRAAADRDRRPRGQPHAVGDPPHDVPGQGAWPPAHAPGHPAPSLAHGPCRARSAPATSMCRTSAARSRSIRRGPSWS